MKKIVLVALLAVSGCSALSNPTNKEIVFESTSTSPVQIEQDDSSLTVKYKSKTETAGVFITKDDKIVISKASITQKKGASSFLFSMLESVVNAILDAVF